MLLLSLRFPLMDAFVGIPLCATFGRLFHYDVPSRIPVVQGHTCLAGRSEAGRCLLIVKCLPCRRPGSEPCHVTGHNVTRGVQHQNYPRGVPALCG
jgi:hypothetical protein